VDGCAPLSSHAAAGCPTGRSLRKEANPTGRQAQREPARRTPERYENPRSVTPNPESGTGYSSLAYLKNLPIDELKIDRSFVGSMVDDDSDLTIVRSTIDLSHNLGLDVVAEGVENAETLDRLADLGCDRAQGYHLSRPLTPSALITWQADSGQPSGRGGATTGSVGPYLASHLNPPPATRSQARALRR